MGGTKSPFHLKRSKLYRKQTIYLEEILLPLDIL